MTRVVACLLVACACAACNPFKKAASSRTEECALPPAELCRMRAIDCGTVALRDIDCPGDGTIECPNTCTGGATCGGAGTPNVCGCDGLTDVQLCARDGLECGTHQVIDGCQHPRTISCPACAAPQRCGGAGHYGRCELPESATCGPQWSWFNPSLPMDSPRAMWGSSDHDVWVVGGNLAHWNGGSWTRASIDGAPHYVLMAISGTSDSDVWAVGKLNPRGSTAGGPPLIAHFDGSSWRTSSCPGGGTLSAVHAIAPNDVWAAGYRVVLHFDGTDWTVAHASETDNYSDITATSAHDVWVVGDKGVGLHWDGATWTESSLPFDGGSWGVSAWAAAPDDVWATEGYDGKIAHFDGVRWTATTSDGSGDVFGLAPNDVFVASPFQHWDGQAWTAKATPASARIEAFGHVADGSAWTLAWPGNSIDFEPSVRRYRAGQWTAMDSGTTRVRFNGIWVNSPDDAWACTNQGPFRYDGTRWSLVGSLDYSGCDRVWASGPNDVWFLRQDRVKRWNGSRLVEPGVGAPAGTEFQAVWGSAADDVWIAGTIYRDYEPVQAVLRHYDGTTWTDLAPEGAVQIGSIAGHSRTDAWVYAERDTRPRSMWLHWDGSTWSQDLTAPDAMAAFYVDPGGDTYAAAYGTGTKVAPFWRRSGSTWTSLPTPDDTASAFRICGAANGHLWVLGDDLVEWDGEHWTPARLAGWSGLQVCAIKDGYGWAGGSAGLLARRCP